jgi:hypothetical protein
LTACRTTSRTATHDTVYIDRLRTEKVVQCDSVHIDRWHNVYTSGDTVYRVDSVANYRLLRVHDTLTLRDSVYRGSESVQATQRVVARAPGWAWAAVGIGAALLLAAGLRVFLKVSSF